MKKLMTTLVLAVVCAIGVAAQTPAQAPMPKELAALQGTWLLTAMNDQPLDGQEVGLVIAGNKYQQVVNGTIVESGTFKIDAAKKPMTFDLTIIEGDDGGKLQLGIVEVTGDSMKGMLSEPGSTTRPVDFMTPGAPVVFVAKKVK